jgi:arylsulfatase A-like enzyme
VIIFTSDNGYMFGERGIIGKAAAYEESIKIPLLMRGPSIPKNETRVQLVNNLDVTATIVDLAGASPSLTLDGRSLTPLFADAKAPWRSAIFLQSPLNRSQKPSDRFTGVRTAIRKYIKYDSGFEELFNLETDPHELTNEADNPSYASDLETLRALNGKLKTCAGTGCFSDR